MADIFLSHATEDRERVGRLAARLEAEAWTVFWSPTIGAGTSWRRKLARELDAAKCVVVTGSVAARRITHAACTASHRPVGVLAPFAVDQAASLRSCGHETVVRSVVPVSMNRTVTRIRTTTISGCRQRPGAVKMSLQFRRVLATPACIAGVLVSRPNFNARCGRTKL